MDPKGPRPTSDKLRLNLHGTCFGGKINWFRPPPKKKKKKTHPNSAGATDITHKNKLLKKFKITISEYKNNFQKLNSEL